MPGTFESMIIFLFNQGGIYVSSLEGILQEMCFSFFRKISLMSCVFILRPTFMKFPALKDGEGAAFFCVFFLFCNLTWNLKPQFFSQLAINWMMNQIFTWKMVGNHQTSHFKVVGFRVPGR